MYGDVVLGVDHLFEEALEDAKQARAAASTPTSTRRRWPSSRARTRRSSRRRPQAVPADPKEQLWGAIGAVFGSWRTPRAVTYRRLHNIAHGMGTAVTVQAMVFGNMGEDCATGAAFTRNPRPASGRTTASS